jgi:hypothetical protein
MRTRSLPVALLAMLAVSLSIPAQSGAAASAKAKGKRLVVSPRAGQVVRSHQVRLRVHSRTLTDTLRVRLNGTPIGEDFGAPRRGMRTLRASLSHGLRRGRNVLRVTVRSRRGAIRATRVRFVVRTSKHLVGAGRDRELAVDGKVQIRGAVRTKPRGDAGAKLRWKLIRAPRRSPAHDALLGGAAPLTLTSPGGRTASFRPRVPGRYTLRLSAGGGSRAASDTVTFEATPPSRLVPIDTMTAADAANGDQRGIRVGDATYLLRDAAGDRSAPTHGVVQVLVLDRATLGSVSNTVYTNPQSLGPALDGIDSSKLVILAMQPGELRGYGYTFAKSLGRIGVPNLGNLLVRAGEISAIGVPGMKPGDADINVTTTRTGDTNSPSHGLGSMKGYLTPDQWGNYGFVPGERKTFTFPPRPNAPCASGECLDRVGFRVRHLDARTLAPAAHDGEIYRTNARSFTVAQAESEARRMAADIAAFPQDDVVMIEAVSSYKPGEGIYRQPVGGISRDAMTRLANEIQLLGGTRNAFNRVATTPGAGVSGGMTYALVGWKGSHEGAGKEVATGVDGAGAAATLSVVLRRDRESLFRPVEEGGAPDALTDLVMEEPTTKWPLDDEPRAKAALSWLGSTNKKISSDPRADYRSQPFGKADWDGVAENIEKKAYTDVPPERRGDFTEAEFLKGRDQLVTELRWVGNVRSYLAKLASPISDSEVLSYATVQDVGTRVHNEAKPPDDEATMRWLEFAEILLELAGPITHEVSSTVAGVMELGTWMFGANSNGGPVEEIPFKANEFGKDLVAQMRQSVEMYKRMGDVIVTDPEKLAFAGENGDCSENSKTCPAGWSFTNDDITRLKSDLQRTVERAAYEELLPLGFSVYGLNPQRTDRAPDPRWYNCGTYPFYYYSPTAVSRATIPLLRELDPQNAKGNLWKPLVLAKPGGSDVYFHAQTMSDKALERVFGPISNTTSPDEGGLGVPLARLVPEHEWHFWSPTPRFRPTQDACS